ncbi:MAG: hypothetical protein IT162_05425 [Bryobacterales bacterium]|nr:hypothetical protein [Bryobacterales bacterium]
MIDFALAARQVMACIAGKYQIPVVTRDIPDPLTGDLDGAEIHIDYAVTEELRLFLLLHLLGHTVQWNVHPELLEIGQLQTPPVRDEALLQAVLSYEDQAARYSATVLREAGVEGCEQWLADFSTADRAYLEHYYRTGEKRDFAEFRRAGTSPLEALPIPPFTPLRRRFRVDGIVI